MQLQKFGLEIRKIGNIKNLYSDVDKILSNSGMKSGTISGDIQAQTVAHSLHRMLQPDRFICVCTIRDCARLCGLVIPAERMALYQAVHCVHWNEMLSDYRTSLIAMVLDDFRTILNP